MKTYFVYDDTTTLLVNSGVCPDGDFDDQAGVGQTVIETDSEEPQVDPNGKYYADDELKTIPSQTLFIANLIIPALISRTAAEAITELNALKDTFAFFELWSGSSQETVLVRMPLTGDTVTFTPSSTQGATAKTTGFILSGDIVGLTTGVPTRAVLLDEDGNQLVNTTSLIFGSGSQQVQIEDEGLSIISLDRAFLASILSVSLPHEP